MITCPPQAAAARQHLLNVGKALRDAENNPHLIEGFTMTRFANPCGTPACALGHYAHRADLQSEFRLGHSSWRSSYPDVEYVRGYGSPGRERNDRRFVVIDDSRVQSHFGIDLDECYELFGERGCNKAATPQEAADYIESFVARKFPQWS